MDGVHVQLKIDPELREWIYQSLTRETGKLFDDLKYTGDDARDRREAATRELRNIIEAVPDAFRRADGKPLDIDPRGLIDGTAPLDGLQVTHKFFEALASKWENELPPIPVEPPREPSVAVTMNVLAPPPIRPFQPHEFYPAQTPWAALDKRQDVSDAYDGDGQTEAPLAPGKRGPKPKVDPKEFEKEVHRYLDVEGAPNPVIDPNFRQADVERHMMTWHGEKIGEARNRQLTSEAIASFRRP